jgi:hypothetical protein
MVACVFHHVLFVGFTDQESLSRTNGGELFSRSGAALPLT